MEERLITFKPGVRLIHVGDHGGLYLKKGDVVTFARWHTENSLGHRQSEGVWFQAQELLDYGLSSHNEDASSYRVYDDMRDGLDANFIDQDILRHRAREFHRKFG